MELISCNSQYVQEIKSMIKEKLGIDYALPKYSFNQECKVHFMFDKEDLKDKCKEPDVDENFTVYIVNTKHKDKYDFQRLVGDSRLKSKKNEENSDSFHVTPKEDIYRIMSELMKDDSMDGTPSEKDTRDESVSLPPPASLDELLKILYKIEATANQDDEAIIYWNNEKKVIPLSSLSTTLIDYLPCHLTTTHPNLLPGNVYIQTKDLSFFITNYYPSTLATVLRYNKHLLESDGGNNIISNFISYQLIKVLDYLHQHNICFSCLSPDSIILTEDLWLFLPLPCLYQSPYSLSDQLASMTSSWVNGKISNFDYIMCLNEAAGRRMDDSNFHSIMPWVCDFTSPTGGWRDFSISKFRMNKGDNQLDVTYEHSVPKHHISEGLSELTYAIYMARCMPISLLRTVVRSNFQAKEYPGNMPRMYEWTPDECIPEYYTDPTVFTSQHANMEDMELPEWCKEPEEFIKWHRSMLESDFVSNHLHLWINLNFGYQLSGQAAVEAKNVPLVQEGVKGLTKNPGFVQLFTQPHPQRMYNEKGDLIFTQLSFIPPSHLPASHVRKSRVMSPIPAETELPVPAEVVQPAPSPAPSPAPAPAAPEMALPDEHPQPSLDERTNALPEEALHEELEEKKKAASKKKKSRKLTMFFSGNTKDLIDLSLSSPSMEPSVPTPSIPSVKETPVEKENNLMVLNGKISLRFNQTKENLMLHNKYATDSFGRSYENILTPCYLAPEELTHEELSLEMEIKADLFKLGCVLYELYTSQPLFTISTLQEYINSKGDMATLTGLNTISEPIRSLVQQLLSVDPQKRPSLDKLLRNGMISSFVNQDFHVKPTLPLFPKSFSTIYEVCSYYYLTAASNHNTASMEHLIETLSSLTIDELPLILPLLHRLLRDVMLYPESVSLPRTFIALWNRIASTLHEEQVNSLLMGVLSECLEQSLQAHNYNLLIAMCERSSLLGVYQAVGPKQFLKVLFPPILELLLSAQTPAGVVNSLVDAMSLLSSPRLLGAALSTRYLLPTLTVKTGSITYKRVDYMKEWPTEEEFDLTLSPAARSLSKVVGYVTPEAVIAVTLAHLFPKAYSLLAMIEPSSSIATLKSTQAAMCLDEIIQVIYSVLPYFSYKMLLYNIIQRQAPGLDDLLSHLYFPTSQDDKCLIYANATLITHIINLYYELASRVGVDIQEMYIIPQLKQFFATFHSFYQNHKDEDTQSLYKSILLNIKKQSIFKKQKLDASLSFYSFELLSLLRESDIPQTVSSVKSSLPEPKDYKSNLAKNLTNRCWSAANYIHMCGGSAGFLSNRSDFDTPLTLSNQVKQVIDVYEGTMYGITVRSDESLFATVGVDANTTSQVPQIIKIWKCDHKPLMAYRSFVAHDSYVHSLEFLPSSPLLASCSNNLCVYDYSKNTLVSQCKSPSGPFTCMASSATSVTAKGVAGSYAWQQLYCATRNSEVICYDIRQKFYDARISASFPCMNHGDYLRPTVSGDQHMTPFISAIATFEDRYFCIGWSNGYVQIMSQRIAGCISEWQAHVKAIAKITFISHNKVLTTCIDGSLSVWELRSNETPKLFAKFVNLPAISNVHTVSVTDYGMGLGVVATMGDHVYCSNDMDLRDYMMKNERDVQLFSFTSNPLCDGITSNPLSKLYLSTNCICPLRRIALCGSDNGKLYVVQ